MNTFKNQKVITINLAEHNKDNLYAITSIDAMEIAMGKLSGNAYKLWHYIQKNQDGFQLALSSKHACTFCGFGKGRGTYNRAVQELIENGYLVPEKGDYYTFWEIPSKYVPK